MSHLLEFDSLQLSFDTRTVLSSVAVKCHTGEIVGILGRNGSGKSSLMKVVFGSQNAKHKSVRVNGRHLTGNYFKERLIAYLPQDNLIPGHIRIRRAMELFDVSTKELLNEFPESGEWLNMYSAELSGGSRRLIEVFMILTTDTPFCILDEPFTGVMPVYVEQLKLLMKRVREKKGIIVTDHMYREVLSITDRLYLLTNGQTYLVKDQQDLVTRGYIHGD